jgi:high frequency lysogenization protein
LELLKTQLSRPQDPEITRYVISLLHHARVLMKKSVLAQQLSEGLGRTEDRLQHFPVNHANILAGLADVYSETISTISPRIMVKGDPRFLSQQAIANQVRALLLAGLRSAVLWQQCGGSRLSLLFGRRVLVDAAAQLLTEIPAADEQ